MDLENIKRVKTLIAESEEIKATLDALQKESIDNIEITTWRKNNLAIGPGASAMITTIKQRDFVIHFIRLLETRLGSIGEELQRL
ncbi:MAG: hypothetical protein IJ307_05765 [Bacteroidales bacterium]|nr:hypothetical protein [Bacteroidales bacterium]